MAERVSKTYKELGNKLIELRLQKGLDQITATKMLKWGASRLGQYERAERKIDLDAIEELANFYGITPEELVGWGTIEGLDEEEVELIRRWRRLPKGTARAFGLTLLDNWINQAQSLMNGWVK